MKIYVASRSTVAHMLQRRARDPRLKIIPLEGSRIGLVRGSETLACCRFSTQPLTAYHPLKITSKGGFQL
jgi:hypothetical protein